MRELVKGRGMKREAEKGEVAELESAIAIVMRKFV